MKTLILSTLLLGICCCNSLLFGKNNSDLSLKSEVEGAIHRSLTHLASIQNPEGFWSSADYPGLSALILRAFLESPVDTEKWRDSETVKTGIEFLKSSAKEDGGIYNRGLSSYNTAISLMCLNVYYEISTSESAASTQEVEDLKKILTKARQFVVDHQQFYDEEDAKLMTGGIGYGNSYAHSDLSNTSLALQALHETRALLTPETEPYDLDWEAAIQFVENTQNLPESNQMEWASDDPENYGGFVYFPGNSKAGTTTLASGKKAHRSYGSMSYAGLMSFLYAGVDKDDPRVHAAVDWLGAHYTLDENPGMNEQGLYYYYYTMAKALEAWNEDTFVLKDGTKIDWRKNLAIKLLNLEQHPGFWLNRASRWMESDPGLVSAYTLMALIRIYPEL